MEQEISIYKPLEINLNRVVGFEEALEAMRLPKESKGDSNYYYNSGMISDRSVLGDLAVLRNSDRRLAQSLVKAGTDHAKFTRGIIVYLKLHMQTGFMIEFETYRHGVECLSTSSSMHSELKNLKGEELAKQKQRDLPEKIYTRILTISYQALRSIYKARRNHRHPDWQIFCDFIETLPYFDVFIYPKIRE